MASPEPTGDFAEQLRALERQVAILEAENAALAEAGEDALLLGLVAEQLAAAKEPLALLQRALERISVLKDVPLCLAVAPLGGRARLLSHYASFTGAPPAAGTLSLDGALLARLAEGPVLLEAEGCARAGLAPCPFFGFRAAAALVLPFAARGLGEAALVLADDRGPERLARATPFLRRACETLVAHVDKAALVDELERLAAGLERQVEARTEALARSEARFRALLEKSSDVVFVLDAGGRVTFWSPGATARLGWPEAAVLGRTLDDLALVHPDDAAAVREADALLFAGACPDTRVVARYRRRDGAWRILEGRARNLLADPAVGGLVVNARDITEERDFEERYQQSQRLEGLGRLAGGIAHDFNNLLTVILAGATAAQEAAALGRPSPPGEAEAILAAAGRARDLTRQLLAFGRRQAFAPAPLDLAEALLQAEPLLSRLLPEDIRVTLEVAPGLWPLLADPGQVEQVLLNLAVNAADAMPAGGALHIEAANVPATPGAAEGDRVRLAVRDTGNGMTPEVKARLFEPFFTTKPRGRGTGLGLATVYGIVRQSGGEIRVESAPGRGSRFELLFPRAAVVPVPGAGAPGSGPRARGGTERLLVAEDEPLVREVTVRTLRDAGYRVTVAASGAEALALAREPGGTPDLLLTDVVMSGLSGLEVATRLRAEHPGLPVLLVSGYADEAVEGRAALEKGAAFLPKPFSREALLARVRALLDGRATGQPG